MNWEYSQRTGRRRRRRRRRRRLKRIYRIILIASILPVAFLFLIFFYFSINTKEIEVIFQDDGLTIEWELVNADECRLMLFDEGINDYVSCEQYEEKIIRDGMIQNGVILRMAVEKDLNLSLQAVKHINLFGHQIPISGRAQKLTIHPMEPIKIYSYAIPEEKIAFLLWQEEEEKDCQYEVYCQNYDNLWETTDNNIIMLDFENEFVIPDRDTPFWAAVRIVCSEEGYTAYGPVSDCVMISRNDLLASNMSLSWEQVEERQYLLKWHESYGEWYQVQQWSEEQNQWISKCTINSSQEMVYQTEHLPSNSQVRFRVITYNNEQEIAQEEFLTEPSEVSFHTDMSTLYCTIWPVTPLKIMSQPSDGEILGEVPTGEALCVLGEEEGCFKIRYQNCTGYIDSDFCMINLPEYLGDLCEYNITNSYSSIFRVHEYDIPQITGGVVAGYENICLGYEDYLVPYLYPCTAKLYQAALNASEDGYALRIYDAFRPNEATAYLYGTVELLLNEHVPLIVEEDETDEDGENSDTDLIAEGGGLPEATQVGEITGDLGMTGETGIEGEVGTVSDNGIINPEQLLSDETYWSIMTDAGRYRLSAFLAATVSAHNRGIALDLTLIDAETREDLPMQSDMHDLSWYSVTAYNNENAVLLSQYMKEAGFNDLVSEWWHFQDDETRNRIGYQSYMTEGVSVEGWKRDDIGWKYRLEDGSYYKNTTVWVDGQECVFDENGYCQRDEY